VHVQNRYRVAAVVTVALALVAAVLYALTTPALAAEPTPGTPTAPRIQTDPFTPNQLCGTGDLVVSANDTVVFAASPTPLGRRPGLRATFAISDAAGKSLITSTQRIWPSGRVLALTLDPGTLSPGTYRFRLRAERGKAVSEWTSWCGFTVNG
jgi:hypothetical protein